jgi:hypothetical protein
VSIRIGKPHTKHDTPSHTRGIRQGNEGPFDKQRGHLSDGRVTAERSTGVNPKARDPIDPSMPNLPPA